MSTIPPTGAVPDVVTNSLIASDWGNAIGASSKGRVVQRFNSTAERDASIAAPITGMVCYVLATDTLYYYRQTGGWTAIPQQTTFYGRAYRAAAWAQASGSALILDTASFDPSLCFNGSGGAGKFTCPASGIYQVSGAISIAANAAGQILVGGLVKAATVTTNGALAASTGAGQTLTSAFSDMVQCSTGDVLALYMVYNSASVPGVAGSNFTYLAVQFLHP